MVREDLTKIMQDRFHKEIREADDKEIYLALMSYTKEKLKELPEITGERKLYYISAEFLIGKLLSNNLINLGIYEEVAEVLRENGKSLGAIEEMEPEPSLGNGGLGRLAACFLDSSRCSKGISRKRPPIPGSNRRAGLQTRASASRFPLKILP